MRQVDENRAENYIKKHRGYRKWLAFALIIALLTGNGTLYLMNKPATAVTQEGAESVGLMLETADAEFEQELISRQETGSGENVSEVVFEEAEDEEAATDEVKEAQDAIENELTSEDDDSAVQMLQNPDSSQDTSENEQAVSENEQAASEDEQAASEDAGPEIPESVDLSEYVTSTVIERKNPDGSWDVVSKEEINEGDWIRITYHWDVPDEAKLSDNISMNISDEMDIIDAKKATLLDGSGDATITGDGTIKVEFNEEVKKEILNDNEGDDELQAKVEAENGSPFFGKGIFTAVLGMMSPLKVYAADEGMTVEGTAKANNSGDAASIELDPNWIQSVTAKTGPTEIWENGKFVGYDTSNSADLHSGDTIADGTVVYFDIDYDIPASTLADANGNLKNCTLIYNISDKLGIIPGGDEWNPLTDTIYRRSDRTPIGTITIQNGVATIEFYESFAKENATKAIDSDFYFAGTVNKSSDQESEEITYNFNEKLNFTVKVVDTSQYDLKIQKSNGGVVEGNKVYYEIRISSDGKNGSGGEITLTDSFSFSNEEAKNTFNRSQLGTITVTKNGKTVKTITQNGTSDGYEFTLPELAKGEEYIVKYCYQYDNGTNGIDKLEQDTTVTNRAVAKTDNFGKKEASSSFTIEGQKNKNTPDIKKEFVSIDKNNKTVTWKIIVNSKNVPLAGFNLKDILTESDPYGKRYDTYYKGNAIITPNPGGDGNSSQTIYIDGENGYTFPANTKPVQYTITITTPYDEFTLIDGNTVYNRATIDDNDHHNQTPAIPSGTIETDIDKDNKIEKKVEEYTYRGSEAVIRWSVKAIKDIKAIQTDDNGRKYWHFIDEMSQGQVITDEQLNALKSQLTGKGIEYLIETGDKVKLYQSDTTGYTTFSIRFYSDIAKDFEYTYETTGSIGDGSVNMTYTNNSYVYSKNLEGSGDSVTYKPMLSKFDGNMKTLGTYNYNDDYLEGQGILTWIIKLEVPGDERAEYGTLTIREHLPETVTQLSEEDGGLAVGTSYDAVTDFESGKAEIDGVTFTRNGSDITFDGDSARGKTFFFRVKAKINEDQIVDGVWKNGTLQESFENKAVLLDKNGDELQWAAETTDVNLVGEIIEKAQIVLNDSTSKKQEIEYTLEINKQAEDLLPGGDELALKDTLRAGYYQDNFTAILKEDGIKVWEVDEDGNRTLLPGDEYSLNVSSTDVVYAEGNIYDEKYVRYSNMEFKLPDKKHIVIEYTYDFERLDKVGDTTNLYNFRSIHVKNDAVLEGISRNNSSDHEEATIKIYRIGATAEVVGADFAKVDVNDISKLLAGGTFSLWVYDSNRSQEETDKFGDKGYTQVFLNRIDADIYEPTQSGDSTFTTTDGSCSFTRLKMDVAYRIVEEAAPGGYKIGKPIYFVYESKLGAEISVPSDFTEKGGVVHQQGERILFTDEKDETTSITVRKEWINADGTQAPITFKLGRRKSHIASTYDYYTVDVYYIKNGAIESYKGYPSVRKGSTLSYNIPRIRDNATTVVVNGNSTVYDGLAWNEEPYIENESCTINGDTTIMIRVNNIAMNYSLQTSIVSSDVVNGDEKEAGADEFSESEYQLSDGNNWKMTFDKLDKNYEEAGKKYEWLYFVKEVSVNGFYDVTYTTNNIHGTNRGTITITNTRNQREAYSLPKTGGTGTLPFVVLGIGLCMTAFCLEEGLKHKKQDSKERKKQ